MPSHFYYSKRNRSYQLLYNSNVDGPDIRVFHHAPAFDRFLLLSHFSHIHVPPDHDDYTTVILLMTIRMILTERHACEVYPNPLISRWLASNVKRRIRTLISSISSFYYVFSIDLSGKVAVRSFAAHAAPAAAHAPVAHEVPAVHDPSLPPLPTGAPRGKIEDGKIMPLEGEVFSVQFAPEGFALVVEPTLYDSLEWVLSSPPPIHQFIEPPVS